MNLADPDGHKKERIKPIKPTKSQLNAIEKLKRLDTSLHVIWSKRGIPSHLCGILSVQEEEPEKAAWKFLSANLKLFKMKEGLKDLKFIRKTDSLGGSHVVFQQVSNELPVHNAFTSVHMDKTNRINKIDICYYPDIYVELPLEGISQEEAIRIALDTLHGENRLAKEVFAEQIIYPKRGAYHAAWKVAVPLVNPIEEWHVFLDFETGNVLDIAEALLKANGWGRVFIPNPVVALEDRTLTAESEIPDRAYSTVVLKELDGSGYLRGKYVDTCNTPNRAKEPDLIFNYKRQDPRFKEVMAYFHIDEAARYIQSIGFTNLCNKTIKVNVHGDFVDNSYYNHDTKELTFGTWYIDDAEDGDIILHEYCHAILDEQVPGFGLTWSTCPIAEGFGDFFAACFFAEVKDGFNRECIGDWNGIGKIGDCVSRVDSKKHYPEDFLGLDSCDRDGEIWSASLWNIYLQMGGASRIKSRRLAARDNAIRLIIESNFNLNLNSRFEDAADAVIIADKNIYSGANEHLIREVFVKRGILFPLVKVEMRTRVEPYAIKAGSILIFSINVTNAGEVVWKRAKIVISIHNKSGLFIKKLVKRINNVKAGAQKSTEKSWRIPKRLKNGEYSYTASAYYSRKKVGSAQGKFKAIA